MTEPLIQAAITALTPQAEAILQDLKAYAQQEITAFGNKIPALLAHADQDVKDAVTALHTHLNAIVTRIDAHLTGQPADPTPAPEAPTS